jgi:hypothetical protein
MCDACAEVARRRSKDIRERREITDEDTMLMLFVVVDVAAGVVLNGSGKEDKGIEEEQRMC